MKTGAHTSWRSIEGRARGAFTLVELLVVVAIIALSLGIVVPTLSGFFASARGPDARNLISANLVWARNYAVANSITTALVFVDDDDDHMRTLMFFAEKELDTSVIVPPDIGFKPVAGREAVYLPNDIVVSADEYDPAEPDPLDPDVFRRIVIIAFSPVGQLTVINEGDDDPDVDDIIVPGGLDPVRQDGGLVSVRDFYLYDFKGSGVPEELYELGINYYTGSVIER